MISQIMFIIIMGGAGAGAQAAALRGKQTDSNNNTDYLVDK